MKNKHKVKFECFCGNRGNVVFKPEMTARQLVFALNKLHRQMACKECPYKFKELCSYHDNNEPLTQTDQ